MTEHSVVVQTFMAMPMKVSSNNSVGWLEARAIASETNTV